MGFNFPNSPIQGQLFTPVGGYQYVWLDGVWRVVEAPQDVGTAQARNRIVNGAMQVSQELAKDAPAAVASGSGIFIADQWVGNHVSAASGLTVATRQDVALEGIIWRIRMNIGATPDAAMAAGDFARIYQNIEGIRLADLQWGTASAKQIILRFTARCSVGGTFCVSIRNSANNRSYIKNCTFTTPAVDQEFTLVIPGDTTGTWTVDTAAGMLVTFCMAAGSTSIGVEGWQAGTLQAASGISNMLATANAFFDLTKIGLYLDPLATGIAPPWVMPDEAEELRACQRYYQRLGYIVFDGYSVAAAQFYMSTTFFTPLRSAPAVTFISPSYSNASGIGVQTVSNTVLSLKAIVTATGAAVAVVDATIANARM